MWMFDIVFANCVQIPNSKTQRDRSNDSDVFHIHMFGRP